MNESLVHLVPQVWKNKSIVIGFDLKDEYFRAALKLIIEFIEVVYKVTRSSYINNCPIENTNHVIVEENREDNSPHLQYPRRAAMSCLR